MAAALMGPSLGALRRVGSRFAGRYHPVGGRELAERLVQAAFNFSTIDRVLRGEELRYESPNTREAYFPRAERDVHGLSHLTDGSDAHRHERDDRRHEGDALPWRVGGDRHGTERHLSDGELSQQRRRFGAVCVVEHGR